MKKSSHPHISAIVAIAENRVIGQDNRLPWHLPADLRHFKAITTSKSILMGRATYASIGKPLPNRTNIVITRDPLFQANGCLVIHSIEAALQMATQENHELFVIGGAQIYQQFLPYIQRIYMTIVHHECAGDTYFPELAEKEWREKKRSHYAADAENGYPYSFLELERE